MKYFSDRPYLRPSRWLLEPVAALAPAEVSAAAVSSSSDISARLSDTDSVRNSSSLGLDAPAASWGRDWMLNFILACSMADWMTVLDSSIPGSHTKCSTFFRVVNEIS